MIILRACEDGDVLTAIRITLIFLDVVKSILTGVIIILGIKDFFPAIISGKEEGLADSIKMLVKRIIAALLVFFLPSILNGVLQAVDAKMYAYNECILKATPEEIKSAYYKKAKELVSIAYESLESQDSADANNYLSKIDDSGKRKELEKELSVIDGYITIYNEANGFNTKEQYSAVKAKASSISDGKVRAKILDALEKRKKVVEENEKKKEEFDKQQEERHEEERKEQERQQQQEQQQQQVNLSGSIVKQEESDTLKVTITKVGSYFVTQIWVKDAYNQLNKFDSPQYGAQLYRPGDLLGRAINTYGLGGKIVIGFNASGFYLKDTYDAASVNFYPAYNKTSVGTIVITNGKVVRNAYNKAYKTWFIAGVDRNNTFRIYNDIKTNDTTAKKAWADSVINDIRNTFTFASPLVMNGRASEYTTSMPSPGSSLNRQAMCQIDSNNFALITGSNLSRNDLINIMLKLKCQTGTNFDGGGSIALLYKGKNSNNIQTIIGNGRALTEVGYFTE